MSRKVARSERVLVSLAPTAHRLRTLAGERGLAVPTLIAALVGEYLAGKQSDALHRRFQVEK